MGGSVEVIGLSKTYGRQNIWHDVTLTLPPGEITAMMGPSGTGKSVFLKSLIGLTKPEQGQVLIDGVDMVSARESRRLELRKKFGVLFQDGALFGSMSVYDNVAFPLREHTKFKESRIRDVVMEKLDMVGLVGQEHKLPGEISGGMKKRAGLARSLVTDPEIILIDEPDSGLDPVRTSNLAELLIEVNAATDATMLVVTHNIELARTLPDNLGMLYRRELVMFGPREEFLMTDHPVVSQFMSGDPDGPIGMSEEADHKRSDPVSYEGGGGYPGSTMVHTGARAIEVLPRQLAPRSGAVRASAERHRARVTSGGATLYVADDEENDRARAIPKPSLPARALDATGSLFALGLDTIRAAFRRPFSWVELLQQFWFVVSVSWVPAMLISIPLGAVIALQLGTLTQQIGAQSFTGAASVLAVVQQASPIVTTLVIAGAGGAAICAELGARTIRDETDAMRVMGLDPVQRLVVPRVLACVIGAVLLNGLVSVVGVLGGYFFNVILQGGTPGAYLSSFTALAQISDLWVGELKAVIFGFLAGVVACYRGLNTAPGPKGVGDSVNQSVVITFLLLFFVNFVLTALYLTLVPMKGPDMADSPAVPLAEPRVPRWLRRPVDKLSQLGADLRFYVNVLLHIPGTLRHYPKEVLRLLSEVSFGSGALAVIGGTIGVMLGLTLSVGFVVGMQGYAALDQIGASALNGFISAYFNTREVAPMVAALALSATVGSGFTAQLGAMKINEEVDALSAMAVSPVPYLITTRVIAGFVAIIPLYVIGLLTSYAGARFVTVFVYGQSAGTYDHYFNLFLPPIDIMLSFVKVLIFSVMIIMVHCRMGYQATGGPAGVGVAVGRAVRRSLVSVAVLDLILSMALWGAATTVRIAG